MCEKRFYGNFQTRITLKIHYYKTIEHSLLKFRYLIIGWSPSCRVFITHLQANCSRLHRFHRMCQRRYGFHSSNSDDPSNLSFTYKLLQFKHKLVFAMTIDEAQCRFYLWVISDRLRFQFTVKLNFTYFILLRRQPLLLLCEVV